MLLGLALLAWIGASAASKSPPVRLRARRDVTVSDASTGAALPDVPTNITGVYCPAVNGLSWTLFREKCYYRYYAPYGIKGTSAEDGQTDYKTWFEAREECAKLGAKLASIHDQATQEKLLQLVAVNETLTSLEETTWIGLQVGTPYQVEYLDGDVGNRTGCYWPASVRPRLTKNDPCPANAVDRCSVTYDDTFEGQWEDGKLYDEEELEDFWSPDEPNQILQERCGSVTFTVGEQNKAYCERGPHGNSDDAQHCALIIPPDEKHVQIREEGRKRSPGKWADYWCWVRVRGYICERPAKRPDSSGDSTAPTLIPGGVTTTPRPDNCTYCPSGRADEVERHINNTKVGYSVVIETMALGRQAAATTWLGGSGSFRALAKSAVDYGRNLTRLSVEVRSKLIADFLR